MAGLLFLILQLMVTTGVGGYTIKGFRYEDNKSRSKWVEGKKGVGVAFTQVEDYFSDQFSECCRVFSEDITKKVSKIGLPN